MEQQIEIMSLTEEQYDMIINEVSLTNEHLHAINTSVLHMSSLLVLICVFQIYGLLSRARKKGGV